MLQPPFSPDISDDEIAPALSSGSLASRRQNNLESSGRGVNGIASFVSESQVGELLSEFSRLEELLLNSPRLPLTGKTMVGEDELLEQMDFIRSNLPLALQTAQEVLRQRDLILIDAQQQAEKKIAAAHQQAFQIANELGIVDRAKAEAAHLLQLAQAECEQLREQALLELEQQRDRHRHEIELMRQQALQECHEIQREADDYADRVLQNVEQKLSELQAQVRRGRQYLNPDRGNTAR
jgi:cell division septum initiation protein DivIVA